MKNIEFRGRQDSMDRFIKSITEKKRFEVKELGVIIKFTCDKCKRNFIMNFVGI